MARPIHEQVIVVTGASSGIGRACVRALASRKATVALIARNVEALEAAAGEVREAGGNVSVHPLDVSDAAAVDAAADAIVRQWGRIDTWMNVAMVSVIAPVSAMTAPEFRRVTEVTYLGYVYGTMAALRHMKPRNEGTIIQIGSALTYRSIPLQSAYCGAKAAIRGFTDSLRSELIHDGSPIKISMLHLPAVNTPQVLRQRNKMDKQSQPVPPMFRPEDIADVVCWAAEKPPRELLIGFPTWQAVWGTRLIPAFLDRYLAKKGYEGQFVDQPNRQQGDILFDSLPGDPGAHGPYRDSERGPDLQMRLRLQDRPVIALAFASIMAMVGLLLRRQLTR